MGLHRKTFFNKKILLSEINICNLSEEFFLARFAKLQLKKNFRGDKFSKNSFFYYHNYVVYFVCNINAVAWVPPNLWLSRFKTSFLAMPIFCLSIVFYHANFGCWGYIFCNKWHDHQNGNWPGIQDKNTLIWHTIVGVDKQHIWYTPCCNSATVHTSVSSLVPNYRTDTCLTLIFYQIFTIF